MLHNINPIDTDAWQRLKEFAIQNRATNLRELFNKDLNRFNKYSINFEDEIFFDFSKHLIDDKILDSLIDLANECKLPDAIEAMFNGENINRTENRAVLHTALRNMGGNPIYYNGKDIMIDIKTVLSKIGRFCNQIHNGQKRGYTGKKIEYIINIGIGGSNLGPKMVTQALKGYQIRGIKSYFVSNIDASDLLEVLKVVNPETTLFIISSKTFTTQETIVNANSAKEWFLSSGAKESDISSHFIAVSTNIEAAKKFGIDENNIFEFWDWVGGRYSLWSAIGISIALSIGFDNFLQLLKGAYNMDIHFKTTPFRENIPILMALIGIWYNNFKGSETYAVFPYIHYMRSFHTFLQQLDMESNGKSISRLNKEVSWQTGPIVWGEVGTNGQHAFYQLLHQGTKLIPCDFIAVAKMDNDILNHHKILLSNFFAQTKALAFGKKEGSLPHKIFKGNRPSTTILMDRLTPYSLGALIASYEHKVFVQGVIWNIYSFDQWGVELGKDLAKEILPKLSDNNPVLDFDPSTNGLINIYKKWKK